MRPSTLTLFATVSALLAWAKAHKWDAFLIVAMLATAATEAASGKWSDAFTFCVFAMLSATICLSQSVVEDLRKKNRDLKGDIESLLKICEQSQDQSRKLLAKNGKLVEVICDAAKREGAPVTAFAGERKVMQTRFHGHKRGGNCTEAAVATLLGLSLEEVGNFDRSEGGTYWEDIFAVFHRYGFELLRFDQNEHGYCQVFDGLYLAAGTTDRSDVVQHMVVMKYDQLWHDPHPDGTGITKPIHVWVAIPRDPAVAVNRLEVLQ